MIFSRETGQEQAAANLRQMGHWLAQRRQTGLPYLAYGTVASLSLWPLVEAFTLCASCTAWFLQKLTMKTRGNTGARRYALSARRMSRRQPGTSRRKWMIGPPGCNGKKVR
jgi:hypothetical protein